MNPRHRPLLIALLLALVVAAAAVWLPDPTRVEPDPDVDEASTQPATSGVWYCPSGDDSNATASVVGAAPPTDDRPSQYVVNRLGAPDDEETAGEVFPGAGVEQLLDDPDTALEVRWSDRPVVVSRLVSHESDPAGVVAGPCSPSVGTTLFVPGITTAAGATARLDIANPFSTEAAVAIDFLTGAGPESPLAVQNVPVPAGETIHVDLAEVMPQREDLVVRITARAGRVAAVAEQQSVPTINGVRGRAMVTATSTADTSWSVPWAWRVGDDDAGLGGQDEQPPETEEPTEEPTDPEDIEVVVEGEAQPGSWLWVANPSEEVAELDLDLVTETGLVEPELVAPLDVDPGSVLRIDLEPLLGDLSGDVGAQVTATNDVPVVVAGGAVLATGGGADRTGLANLAAHRRPDTSWTLTGPAGSGRRQLLTIANPTEDEARVNVSAWTGVTSVRPADLQDLQVAPGHTLTVDLAERGLTGASATAFVTTVDGQVTASLRSAAVEGPLALSVVDGIPSRTWVSSGIATAVQREDGMVNRYGTDLGLDALMATESPTDAPAGGDDFADEGIVDPSAEPTPGASTSPSDPAGTPSPPTDASPT
ncbi:DUF5719 family protein, partial [Salsipaludibacter albus]|uniref:DUF5719 family protein n=1 Tax=Salsipaludibacter albus TaxID=2849650 RepID=UPI001EE48982